MEIPFSQIQHVGIPVTNLSRSVEFYESLGFGKAMEAFFDHAKGKGTCVMMTKGTITMELYEMPEPELAAIRNRKDGHIDHIAFDVKDIDQVFQMLKEAGYTILEDAPVFLQFWKRGCRYFNIKGPDGERLEFNQIL